MTAERESAASAPDVRIEEVYAVADPAPESGLHLLFARASDDRVYHVGRFDADSLSDAAGMTVPAPEGRAQR